MIINCIKFLVKAKWFIFNQMDQGNSQNQQSIMVVYFNWFWWSLLYLFSVNNCHPWWLVGGLIPVMTSYGHGFGN